jgi:hypothetical protein
LLKEHGTDDNRDRITKPVIEPLELSGCEIDEQAHAIRKAFADLLSRRLEHFPVACDCWVPRRESG